MLATSRLAILGRTPGIEGLVPPAELEAGPVLVTVEYQIDPARRDEFSTLVHVAMATRRRDGAYAWGVYHYAKGSSR